MKGLTGTEARKYARVIRLMRAKPRALVEFQTDPVGFCTDFLRVPEHTLRWSVNPGYENHRWDGDVDPLVKASEALGRREDVGIESGTGTGKSAWLAMMYLWFLGCFEDSRVFTFAPKADQLRLYSWQELDHLRLWPRFKRHFKMAEKTDLRIRMVPGSDAWGAWGYPVKLRAGEEIAGTARGMHAEHLLLVYEELPNIDAPVLEAGRRTATGEHNLILGVGNPDHQQDALHLHCEAPGTTAVRISALDYPNLVVGRELIGGAVTRKHERQTRQTHGVDHRFYTAKIRGISPEESQDALIRRGWVMEAIARAKDLELREELRELGFWALGVDCARSETGDLAAIAKGYGALCEEVESFQCPDVVKLGTKVGAIMGLLDVDERHCGIDPGGVGGGAVDQLSALGLRVQALHASGKVWERLDADVLRETERPIRQVTRFGNFRSQMNWQLRLDLQHGRIGLPDDPELVLDLITPTVVYKLGKVYVEKKEDIVKRLGRSPNKGDALALWNWVRHRRRLAEEEKIVSAWDQEVLEYEARESRRVRATEPVRHANLSPALTERVK